MNLGINTITYDCVKSLAKQRQINYTEAQKIVDYGVYRYIESQNDDEFLRKNISEYANTQKVTEVCAESFSVMNSNEIAKKIIEIVGRRNKQ